MDENTFVSLNLSTLSWSLHPLRLMSQDGKSSQNLCCTEFDGGNSSAWKVALVMIGECLEIPVNFAK